MAHTPGPWLWVPRGSESQEALSGSRSSAPPHRPSWDPQDSGLRLFLPLPPRQASHLCCKVSRT